MEIVTYFLLTNKQTYHISKANIMKYPESRLAQFDKLYKFLDMYYVEYDAEGFADVLNYYRHEDYEDRTNLTYHLIFDDDWSWMLPDTVQDKLINLYIADEPHQILYSTLCRFPDSKWAKEAATSSHIEVDLDIDVFKWIIDLYRGINLPDTLPSKYAQPLSRKYLGLRCALKELNLPDGITGEYDICCVQRYCNTCMYVNCFHGISDEAVEYTRINLNDNYPEYISLSQDIYDELSNVIGVDSNPDIYIDKFINDPIQHIIANTKNKDIIAKYADTHMYIFPQCIRFHYTKGIKYIEHNHEYMCSYITKK